MSNPKYPEEEPAADLRIAAGAMRQMYVALVNEGFTQKEAIAIIGVSLANARNIDDD